MQLKETREALNNFGKFVVQQAKSRLTKSKKNVSKKLYNSLDYNINASNDSISVVFEMEDYGKFQDLGVSGKKTKYNTPYSYKSKMPPAKSFSQWVVRKGLDGVRDKKGRFIKRKSMQFLIARSIYEHGIKPSMFFTKPFNQAFDKLPPELQEKFGIDIENLIFE
jgi:hypothetical protein|tara:strand:+ start:2483 stop:2977 length:495 start_codon:yes stop_codon:yes gene_type:complete